MASTTENMLNRDMETLRTELEEAATKSRKLERENINFVMKNKSTYRGR